MGAGNSTPQTARIENPQRGVVPIQITPSVVTRLEEQLKLQQQECSSSCGNENEEPKKQNNLEHQEIHGPATNYIQREQYPLTNRESVSETIKPPPPPPPPYSQTSDDAAEEEYQFNATLDKLEHTIGEPMAWNKNIEKEILSLRKDLIKCYQDHPGQTLHCSDAANKYQEFIFREQYRHIMKFNSPEKHEQNEQQLPHYHKPPYK